MLLLLLLLLLLVFLPISNINERQRQTNMPIKRFADFLHRRNELKDYLDLLVRNFNPDTAQSLMCLNTVSIGYDGSIFDCDFNQQLGFTMGGGGIHEGGVNVFDIESYNDLSKYGIRTDNHCYGCK